ncbi:MAG TPA: DUF2279 domain-containing protein [Candidatus Kapabacteria bacterium]|nr:DUF2279 domain-containing protein [Candidatus Kapabacteria bacterium]
MSSKRLPKPSRKMFAFARKLLRDALIVSLFLFVLAGNAKAQEDSSITLGVAAASLLPVAVMGGALYQNYVTFWKDGEDVPFHFSSDPPYAMHNDKLGHAWFAATSADIFRLSYLHAGLKASTAAWLGSSVALTTELLVEIADGYRSGKPYFGFSPGDAIADVIGASLPLLRHYAGDNYVPQYKISFWPSDALHAYSSIIDDNESQFFWLSFQIPSAPKWLNVAVGHGVENIDEAAWLPERQGKQRATQLYLAPDLDLTGLPIKGKAWDIISQILSHIRLPLPSLQLSPQVKLHWLR